MANSFARATRPLKSLLTDKSGKTVGHKVRDTVHRVSSALHPFVVKVIPNFRAAHYVYIIFMTFLGSVIVYPIADFAYIDILFTMTGCATQAGLNTINLNELRLSQQIFVYIFTTLCTPIFIHSSLLLIRLFWFERHFDNIKESSMLDHKMRKTATLAARTASRESLRVNTVNNQDIGLHPHESSTKEASSGTSPASSNVAEKATVSTPADPSALGPNRDGHAIRFDELPHPAKKRRAEVDPSDMYKSIAMLQNKHTRKTSFADDDVLVIKSPKEIERDNNTPIFTRKHTMPFASGKGKKWTFGSSKRKGNWEKLRRTLSNSSMSKKKKRSPSQIIDEDNASIDSETHDHVREKRHIDDIVADAVGGDDDDEVGPTDVAANRNHASGRHNAGLDDEEEVDEDEDDQTSIDEDDSEDSEDYDEESITRDPVSNEEDVSSHHDIHSGNSQAIADTDEEDDNLDPLSPNGDRDTSEIREGSPTTPRDRITTFSEPEKRPRPRVIRHRRSIRRWRTPLLRHSPSNSSRTRVPSTSGTGDSDEEESLDSSTDNPLSRSMSTNYLSWTPTVGRNSTFVDLTEEQKDELGGVEYRAVKLLLKILGFYYVGFHVIAFCMLVGYIKVDHAKAVEMRSYGFSPVWWGFFTAMSTFNDLGFTLTPNSMSSFNESPYVLIVCSFFIVIGNTGFPILLRFLIWVLFKIAKPVSLFKESLGFLLDHPRRCFTLLFPSLPTWWLFFILVLLNAVDLILFVILDLGSSSLKSTPKGLRVLDGLFQAFSTRTAGLSCIDLSQLHPAVQVSYMIMMYISVLPLAISIRRTNVYEEQSLGIYLKSKDEPDDPEATPKNFIGTHLRNQLSFDLWFIFLGLFIICIAEAGKLRNGDVRFSVFSVLFEVVSAYGTVGLSLGYPNVDQSLSYKFTTISKLVIIAMQIRGRHRGLPYSLDRAIMLPDSQMRRRDQVQEHHAIARATTLESARTRDSFHEEGVGGAFRGLTRAITRTALSYRRNSLFPAPTRLESEEYEMHGTTTGR